MSKIKLTKGELKKQRDSLKQFRRYLPTLQLKKQQLQMKILEARRVLFDRLQILENKSRQLEQWVGLLADRGVDITLWLIPQEVRTAEANVAGANVLLFREVTFRAIDYDLYTMPFWTDRGIEELRVIIALKIEIEFIRQQIEVLERELRVTTQRVNLFEKIKIPECLNTIRVIRIYLGDQQANAVGISKVAKKKVVIRDMEPALAG